MVDLTGFNVDWNTVKIVDFEPLAEGTYPARITKSGFKKTKKGDQMLEMTFEILGQHKGRLIFESFMFTHKNPAAVQMGQGRVKQIAEAIGLDMDEIQDTSELHDKPISVKVKIERSEQYGDKNKITSFKAFEEDSLTSISKSKEIEVEEVVEVEEEETELTSPYANNVEGEMIEDEAEEGPELPSPQEIETMKKAELLFFIKDQELEMDLAGKKVKEIKAEVIKYLFDPVVEDDEDDIIIEE